jgi:Gene Transfer Agent (GTA)-like protein/putative tail protein
MAVILLQAAGAALGGLFGPVGAVLGQAAGALAGSLIDSSLFGSSRTVSARGLSSVRIPSADEGTPIARVQGSARVNGTLIWATRFEENVTVERTGGKGGGGTKVESRSYAGNFAFGLCEGPVAMVRRVWADGRELDLSTIEMRLHRGSDDQMPDPLIEARQGVGETPGWRGLAYVVFERLPLEDFGNRIPAFNFEVVRPVGDLEARIKAVTCIPGGTEHGYALTVVSEQPGAGEKRLINRNSRREGSDWTVSIDELQALCPNLKTVALVTAWMGTDLRAGHCSFVPGVEVSSRNAESRPWRVGNYSRATARLISRSDGHPAYGGTPDDASVIEAIANLKARGLEVVLYPFVLMDIPEGNALPDPDGGDEQPPLPWRGRITCIPASGRDGSPNGTAAIRDDIAALCGTTAPAHIHVSGATVSWSGGDDGYRRMILHHAALAQAAGGVDGFLIGSELRGLTPLTDDTGAYPFVEALCDLAAEIKAMLGSETVVTYAADWSEYWGYRPADSSGDVAFHLDALWAHEAIGAVAIDNYMPLSDWRDGDRETGSPDGERQGADRIAMERAVTAGEGYDWYYASDADRVARIRTPIVDGVAGKDWVYRVKDIRGWWQNLHYDRTGGVEAAEPTAWVPASKPVWLTEIGCPAVDKGATEPYRFPDPRSVEGGLPRFSTGARDDAVQRAFLSAHIDHWTGPANADAMVDASRVFAWTWDARPYPTFPSRADLWSDFDNWRTGHWLNGRFGGASLADLFADVLTRAGIDRFDVSGIVGAVSGHATGGGASARDSLEPLMKAFAIDMREGPQGLEFVSRLRAAATPMDLDIVADPDDEPRFEDAREQESALPGECVLRFFDPLADHTAAGARSRRISEGAVSQAGLALEASLDVASAAAVADLWLKDRWAARRSLRLALSPNRVEVEPGDLIRCTFADAPEGLFRVERIEDGAMRRIEARGHALPLPLEPAAAVIRTAGGDASAGFAPDLVLADLPLIRGSDESAWGMAAAHMKPWRALVISASSGAEGYAERTRLDAPARIGRLAAALSPGTVEGRFDTGSELLIDLPFGGFESLSRQAVLDGGNAITVETGAGWEILQFETAEEIAAGRWRLTSLLRGQAGTDDAMRAGAPEEARALLLDRSLRPLGIPAEEAGLGRNYIAELSGRRTGAVSGPVAFAGGMRARTPFSPVHPRAKRTDEGVRFNWIRRGRSPEADSWTSVEVPLEEEIERYRLILLDGGTEIRIVEVGAQEWIYPAADEIADFGAARDQFELRIEQGGRSVPWGVSRWASVAVQ